MRGAIGDQLTLQGDKLYDYGKLLQSLFGFDHILMHKPLPSMEYKSQYISQLVKFLKDHEPTVKIDDLFTVTAALTFGSLKFHEPDVRSAIFNLVNEIFSYSCVNK